MAFILKSPCLNIQGVGRLIPWAITLTGRGNKLQLLGVLTLGLGLLAFIDIMEPCSLALDALSALTVASASTSALESASSSWCCRSFFLTSRASFSSFSFSQCHWYRPSVLYRGLYASSISLSHSDLVGLRRAEAAKSQDLNKVGPDEVLGQLMGARESIDSGLQCSPQGLRGASVSSGAGSLVSSRPASRTVRAWIGAEASFSSGRPFVRWYLRTGKLTAGFFPRGTRRGACNIENTLVKHRQWATMNRVEQESSMYLPGLLVHKALSLLFPTALGFGRHLFRVGIPCLEDHQFLPCLLCKEQKGVRSEPSKKVEQNRSGKYP
ncbi:hypothetical protein Cgig2_026280 [Carnegiea gigantea]|uniref:Uncharacterized protein n=1 Tax=Carnegiea gigantea TaxID=171969 RepID=A0A9Q1JQL4_9CARY|nr:hypothetical protein Cgig2_026280 [Carnegiea gigantea]